MSSSIDLVLGNGLGNQQLAVPDIVGLTVSQAREYISGDNISIGVIIAESPVSDTANAYIIKQNPEPKTTLPEGEIVNNRIRPGQMMDVWISMTPPPSKDTIQQAPQTNNNQ